MMTNRERILVVDDSPDNVLVVESLLQEEGYDVVLAYNGFQALESIQKSAPQLILLDVMMPEMDGFEVTRRIRSIKDLPFIPILLITAYDRPSVVEGLDLGADDFIRKPIEIEELLARVRSLLRLKHSVDRTEEMVRIREDFVSRLTHDLRTPLVAMKRMLELIEQGFLGEFPPQLLEAIQTMERSNSHLLEMVNTLLEVYRYEAERKVLHFSPIDLGELLKETIDELIPLAEVKGLFLEQHIDIDSQSFPINSDRQELRRVFTNIIANAIKFTDIGTVDIYLEITEDNSWWKCTVKDSGPGITPEEQQCLFERFRQGNNPHSDFGLGLYLSHQIIVKHRGKIEVFSQLGQGSSFIVSLPIFTD